MSEITYHLDDTDRIVTLTLDSAGPVNTLGQTLVTELEAALDRAGGDGVRGLILASAKKSSFIDGGNLKEMFVGQPPQTARDALNRFRDLASGLAKAPYPVAAVLRDQRALGAGFQLLLWGADRVFATPGSKVGLPEVNLGLIPASGGSHVLRKMIGLDQTLDLVLSGRLVGVDALADTGFVTILGPDQVESAARAWLIAHPDAVNRNLDPAWVSKDDLTAEAFAQKLTEARVRYEHPAKPWFGLIFDSLAEGRGLSLDEAARKDADRFTRLVHGSATRNKIDFFFLKNSAAPKLAKVDGRKAVKVDRLAVIGAGLMGRGIAQVSADAGFDVLLIDADEDRTRAARESLAQSLAGLVAKGKWKQARMDEVLGRIQASTDYGLLAFCPLVIEAVFEDLDLKKKILARVEDAAPDAIFASNTSTIPMADIAAGAKRPDRVVGMHYFSPVPLMPLLEVIQGPESSPQSVATAVTVGRATGRTVILVGDGPGFYTSRTFSQYVLTGFRLVEMGASPWDVDQAALDLGFPQGPLSVYGATGGAVVYHANHFLASRRPDRITVPATLGRLFEAGYVGGNKPSFYLDARKKTPDSSVLDHVVRIPGTTAPPMEDIRDLLILSMVNEAFWCLSEGVLKDYASMDLGSVLGIGFPDVLHGPGRYVSQKGVNATYARLNELYTRYGWPSLVPAPEFAMLLASGVDNGLI
jgi:3-hydroxyacyl-CoA dehydrogenase/enoyl-CoA hydratase/3-hydroxybutyryl-CoA epimerase